MRAISLWQPWASACFHLINGRVVKGLETRHWATDYRGPLVIHAAKRWTAEERKFAAVERTLGRLPHRVPLGALIGIVQLVDVRPTDELKLQVGAIERVWGNYAPGRFGWVFADPKLFAEPIAWQGRQSFFTVPDEVVQGRCKSLSEAESGEPTGR